LLPAPKENSSGAGRFSMLRVLKIFIMSTLEKYFHSGSGYNPHLIRDGWQLAQLNYAAEQAPSVIDRVERHVQSDEAFVLCKGSAMLVTAVSESDILRFEVCRMTPFVTYNVPKGTWHNIAMTPDDIVLIVERSNTHLQDVEYRDFTVDERQAWQETVVGSSHPQTTERILTTLASE
jgi:hypothetical protein